MGYNIRMKALLIIDMQQGSFTALTPRYDADRVIAHINKLAAALRENGFAVIFIQHDGRAQGDFIPGSEAWKLLPELMCGDPDLYVSKTANDCFYRSQLNELLRSNGIDEIVITGCATDFCVDTTVKSAITLHYNITVISDGHTTVDRDPIPAADVITHYNRVWENMLPVNGSSPRVMTCNDYLSAWGKNVE